MQQSIRATASTNYINATVADQLKFKASRGVHKHVNDKDATVCLGFFRCFLFLREEMDYIIE